MLTQVSAVTVSGVQHSFHVCSGAEFDSSMSLNILTEISIKFSTLPQLILPRIVSKTYAENVTTEGLFKLFSVTCQFSKICQGEAELVEY